MNIREILGYIIVVGCIAGAYAYKASVISSRQRDKLNQDIYREGMLRKVREKEREASLQKEAEEKANNAQYQLNHWYKTYSKLMGEWVGKMSMTQVKQLKRDLRDAWEYVLFWNSMREHEIERDKEEGEYQRLSRMWEDLINDDKNSLDDEELLRDSQCNIEQQIRRLFNKRDELSEKRRDSHSKEIDREWSKTENELTAWIFVRATEFQGAIEKAFNAGDNRKKEYYQEELKDLLKEFKDKTGAEIRFDAGHDPLDL